MCSLQLLLCYEILNNLSAAVAIISYLMKRTERNKNHRTEIGHIYGSCFRFLNTTENLFTSCFKKLPQTRPFNSVPITCRCNYKSLQNGYYEKQLCLKPLFSGGRPSAEMTTSMLPKCPPFEDRYFSTCGTKKYETMQN